jgi:hypothetical protein
MSANIVINLTWNSDFSLSASFTSEFFHGLNPVTKGANSFTLKPDWFEYCTVGHEPAKIADTCTITFNVSNSRA